MQQQTITLSDGKTIPAGTQICTTSYAVSNDTNIIPQQDFDGFRYYKLRQQLGESQGHQYSSIDRTHLHFGAGFNACPGRWLAGHQLKMMVGELLLNYDIKFLDGQNRPGNTNVDEFIFTDPDTPLMMKKREL